MKKFKSVDMHFTESAVKMHMPLTKIDEEHRLVSGFATLDNEDTAADIVTADASVDAFSRFRGNIREMHQPIAAGRLVDFSTKSYYDPETATEYNGIYVTAYISRGAESTWQKVLDGTLGAFSIHGGIEEAHLGVSKTTGNEVRYITQYDLDELSLVDNPGNQLANIFSIEKSADGKKATGITADITIENIFYCDTDGVGKCSRESEEVCDLCDQPMKNIAWVESSEDKMEKVAKAVSEYKNGGETMEKNTEEEVTKAAEENVEEQPVVDNEETEEVSKDATEEVVNEETSDDNDLEKVLAELRNTVDSISKSGAEGLEALEKSIDETLNKAKEGFEGKFNELQESHTGLSKRLEELSSDLSKVKDRIDTVEKGVAVKKSAELDDEDTVEKVKKSVWDGAFFDASRI